MLHNGKAIVLMLATLGAAGCAQSDYMGPRQRQMLWQPTKPQDMSKASPAVEPKILPETYFAAARLFEQQGLVGRAIAQYRKAIAVNHKYVAAYHRLGVLLNATAQHNEATRALRKAVDLQPNDVVLRNNLGFSLMLQGRWEDAETEFRTATRLKPGFVRAHVNLGMVLAQMGRFDEALGNFQAALPEPDAYYNLGLMYRTHKRYDEAAEAFRHVLNLDAEFSAARTQLERIAEHLTPPQTDRFADASVDATEVGPPPPTQPPVKAKSATMAATIIPEPVAAEPPESPAVDTREPRRFAPPQATGTGPYTEDNPCEEEEFLNEVFGEFPATSEEEPEVAVDGEEPIAAVTIESRETVAEAGPTATTPARETLAKAVVVAEPPEPMPPATTVAPRSAEKHTGVATTKPTEVTPSDEDAIIPALRVAMEQARLSVLARETSGKRTSVSHGTVVTTVDHQTFATVVAPASTQRSWTPVWVAATTADSDLFTEVEQYTEIVPVIEVEPSHEVEQFTEFDLVAESVRLAQATANESTINADSVEVMDAFERLVGYFPEDVWCWDGVDWEAWETIDVIKLAEAEMMAMETEFAMTTPEPTAGFDAVRRETPATKPVGLDVVLADAERAETTGVAPVGRHVAKKKQRQATDVIVQRKPYYAIFSDRESYALAQSPRPVDRQTVLESLEQQLARVREEIECWDEAVDESEFETLAAQIELVRFEEEVAGRRQRGALTFDPPRETMASQIIVPANDPDVEVDLPVPPIDAAYFEASPDECSSVFDEIPLRHRKREGGRVLITNKPRRPTS